MKKAFSKVNIKGFTLLELLMALTILVSTLILGASFIKKKENNIKKTFRQLIALNRQLDHFARLKRETYRLAIHIDEKKSSLWVEKKLPENQIPLDPSSSKNQTLPPTGFVIDTDFFEKPYKLPGGLKFESLQVEDQEEPITDGKAYIYYFPEGQFNKALLNIKGKKVYWSILIDRLHGELTVFNEKKNLQELEQ